MDYQKNYENWLNHPAIDSNTKAELESIANNPKEIEDRFYKELDFGTGGLRGVLGAGSNRLNIYTIRKATQGLANYILQSDAYQPGMAVAIAHDSRNMSPEFSTEAALVLNANGIKTYTFDALRPTPLLSFAVRHLGCIAGIVVTASHNPPEYNGYKVYWQDGGQVPSPRDEEIIAEVNKIADFAAVKTMAQDTAAAQGLFNIAPAAVDEAFISNVKAQSLNNNVDKNIGIVFTPLHGAGNVLVQRVLAETGFNNVHVVKSQEAPDGNFPTVDYPNPEDVKAFTHALDLAKTVDADIVVATDPDCDRVGVAIKHQGKYQLLNGNMTGVILTEYIISQLKLKGEMPENGAIISTIVSTNMVKEMAKQNGLSYIETLTGFKYIGEKITQFEKDNAHKFIFGFEESYGYLAGEYARDKDGVVATMLACEAAAYYKAQGKTLEDVLQDLYQKYGLYKESIEAITLKGIEGIEKIKEIMANLRQSPPTEIGGCEVIETRDYTLPEKTGLPFSDVLYYETACGSWACVRPSGTEPKIKIYFGAKLPKSASPEDADNKLKAMAHTMLALV